MKNAITVNYYNLSITYPGDLTEDVFNRFHDFISQYDKIDNVTSELDFMYGQLRLQVDGDFPVQEVEKILGEFHKNEC